MASTHNHLSGKKWISNLLALAIGSVLMGILIAGGELILSRLNNENKLKFTYNPNPPLLVDKTYGIVPLPDTVVQAWLTFDNDLLIYDVKYSIDSLHRRITPFDTAIPRSKYALFFGCSFTFGEGVNDNQTLPFYFAKYYYQYHPYNYGYGGYGPQQMLEKLKSPTIRQEVKEGEGILVYTLIDCHIWRAIGSMRRHAGWAKDFPYYCIDDKDYLIRKGTFTTGRPFTAKIYSLLGKSEILKRFNIEIPWKLSDKHFELFCRILLESKRLFKEKFASDKFYVLIFPRSVLFKECLMPYFEKYKIEYFDYSQLDFKTLLEELSKEEYPREIKLYYKYDNHPTALTYQLLARQFVSDLKLRQSSNNCSLSQ